MPATVTGCRVGIYIYSMGTLLARCAAFDKEEVKETACSMKMHHSCLITLSTAHHLFHFNKPLISPATFLIRGSLAFPTAVLTAFSIP
jgi:hypothetical protein